MRNAFREYVMNREIRLALMKQFGEMDKTKAQSEHFISQAKVEDLKLAQGKQQAVANASVPAWEVYQKALSEGQAEKLEEKDYRYPGPKPQSKETAIVLLADSVEGATRSLDEHTPRRIEDVVRKVINNKFIDGQLDECNLTLREIDTIASTFVRVLGAMYHSRVKYPEKSNGNNTKKSSKEDPDFPGQDPQGSENSIS